MIYSSPLKVSNTNFLLAPSLFLPHFFSFFTNITNQRCIKVETSLIYFSFLHRKLKAAQFRGVNFCCVRYENLFSKAPAFDDATAFNEFEKLVFLSFFFLPLLSLTRVLLFKD